MKKTLLLAISFMLVLFTMAQQTEERRNPNGSNTNNYNAFANLTIGTTGNNNLRIVLNGKRMNQQDRSVTYEAMRPGNYQLRIYQRQANRQTNAFVEVYSGTISLKQQKHYEVVVNRFGKVYFDEGFITNDEDWNDGSNPYPGGNNNGYQQPVTEQEFVSIKKAISQAFSDDDKLLTAKAVLKNNLFSTAQIKVLVNLFFQDNGKVALAKYAYDYCVDVNNYYTLADSFFSTATKNDFMTFLRNK